MKSSELVALFVNWQLVIIIISCLAVFILPVRTGYVAGPPPWLSRLNFDGINFRDIARYGYSKDLTAFFPLFPLITKIFDPLFVATIGALGFFLILNKLLLLDYPPPQVKHILLTLMVFPTSFFLVAGYSESLFLFLVVSCFYLYRRDKQLLALLFGSLATATRFVGFALVPALFVVRRSPQVLLILFGLVFYMLFLKSSFGDPAAFLHILPAYGEFRSDKIILLPQVYWRYIKIFATVNHFDFLYLTIALEFVVSLVFLGLSLLAFKKLSASYAIFNFIVFITPTFTGSFVSLPRYVLACFPSFILIGLFLSQSKFKFLYILVSSALSILFLALFTQGYWVS